MYFTNFLQIKNIYDFYDKQSSNQKHHILTTSKEVLEGELKEGIKNLCVYLWENPNFIIFFIQNSYNRDLVENLIQLIIERFFTNLLSQEIIEPQLFYIISYFLKKEINEITLKNKSDFLKKTVSYKLFKKLRRNPKLIIYFRHIIKKIVNEVYIYSQSSNNELYDIIFNNRINLSINKIEEKINEKRNEEKRIKEKSKSSKNNMNYKKFKKTTTINENLINYEEIKKKYFLNISKSFLEGKIKEYENNILLKEFCKFQLNSFYNFANNQDKNELFTNDNLLKNLSSCSIKEVENIYIRNLSLSIHFMNHFLNILNEEIKEIPLQIRQICKIIKLLVKEKFPDIKKFELNAMIGIFFFENLLFPLFTNPQLNSVLLTSKNLSEDLYYNLFAIASYLKCLIHGYFYFEYNDECDYTPFNAYFIEKLPLLDEILEKICDVEIPKYIQKLVFESKNDDPSNEINFNYLYNEKYIIYHQAFCLTFGELSFIMKNIYINQDKLFENEKNSRLFNLWDKIYKHKSYKDLFSGKSLKENPIDNKKIKKISKTEKTPLEKETQQIYEFINNISSKKKITKEYFIINNTMFKINKKNFNEEELLNKNFLNYDVNNNNLDMFQILKDSLCDILNNLPSFNELIYSKQLNDINIKDFNTLIIELKKYFDYYSFNHMNFEQSSKSIELKWALNFFLEKENKILNDLNTNNYFAFFNQIENDINNSINEMNNNCFIISNFEDNNLNIIRNQQISAFILNKLKKMNTNLIVQKIIKKYSAFIQISTKIVKNKNQNKKNIWSDVVFEIKKGKEKDDKWYDINNVYISEKNNYINYKTIESFIENFTFENEFLNIDKYNNNGEEIPDEKKNIFDYLAQLKIPEKINTYIDISIKELLFEKIYHNIYSKQDVPLIVSKIKKKIFCSLYDIIYRNYVPCSDDNLLHKKSIMLSWTNLSHFTNEQFPLHQSLVPSIVENFKQLEKKKIPKVKLSYLIKVNEILSSIHCQKEINFNNKKLNNIDYLNPVLIYSIIKSKPLNLASDIRFIEVFMNEKDKEIKYLKEIKKHISFIIEITYKDLYGNMNEENYYKNCNMYFKE